MIPREILKKVEKADTGFSLHYAFLYSLVVGLECKNVLEFGSGYSTHCILKALEKTGGNLRSIDVTDSRENLNVTKYSKRSKQWNFHHGNSNDVFPEIDHPQYDLILHDGSHVGTEVLIDINNAYNFLKYDGILLLHDTRHPDLGPEMMRAFDDFERNKEIEFCHLPYGYGLSIIRNKENSENKVELTWEKKGE